MSGPTGHVQGSDLVGYGRLAQDATLGVTDVVEHMQQNLWQSLGGAGGGLVEPAATVAGWVFGAVRGVTRLVGGGVEAILGLIPDLPADGSSAEREAVLAVLNGLAGEHLATTGNPLAIPLRLRRSGRALRLERSALAAAVPEATGRLLVLVHGLCMDDLQWRRNGHDHGAALAAESGFTTVYLHYNSGQHVSVNGRAFAGLLQGLLDAWPVPVEALVLLGHSMGGLVIRSACHYGQAAGHAWPERLGSIVFLGTPHHGAPLEQGGNWLDAILEASAYTTALARLGKVRSAGITDLRHGSLVDEDWMERDRFARSMDRPRPVPLPAGVHCYAIGACIGESDSQVGTRIVGDGLVPLDSALGRHRNPALSLPIPEARTCSCHGIHHLDLLDDPRVYQRIRQFVEDGSHP